MVDKNIPVPEVPSRNRYGFKRLKDKGDSIYFECGSEDRNKIRAAACMYASNHGFYSVTRSDDNGIRVWRADDR